MIMSGAQMSRSFWTIIALLVVCGSARPAAGDIVVLKDGRRFTGQVTQLSEEYVAIHAVISGIGAKLQFSIKEVLEVGYGPVPQEVADVIAGKRPRREPLDPAAEAAAREERLFRMLKAIDYKLQWIDVQMIETDQRAQRLATRQNRWRSPGDVSPTIAAHPQFDLRKNHLQRMRGQYAQVRNMVLQQLGWGDLAT